jgi:hypothetical protein
MSMSTYLSVVGAGLGAIGAVYSVYTVVRQFLAERALTTTMAQDEEFRRIVKRQAKEAAPVLHEGQSIAGEQREGAGVEALQKLLDDKRKAREEEAKEWDELISVLAREVKELKPEQKQLLESGLHQPSEEGQRRYAAKLVSQSKSKVANAH